MTSTFAQLGLPQPLVRALARQDVVEPFPVQGSASTSVQVFGPPELDVVVRHPTRDPGPDVQNGEIYDLTVEITNTSPVPALYTSLELFLGGDVRLVDGNGDPVPGSVAEEDFGHVQPGQTVARTFRVESLVQGEIIACQGVSSQNITLSVDIGPDPNAPCDIANTIAANFQPLPAFAPPAYRTATSKCSVRTSTIFPLPSSPHCRPTTAVLPSAWKSI